MRVRTVCGTHHKKELSLCARVCTIFAMWRTPRDRGRRRAHNADPQFAVSALSHACALVELNRIALFAKVPALGIINAYST